MRTGEFLHERSEGSRPISARIDSNDKVTQQGCIEVDLPPVSIVKPDKVPEFVLHKCSLQFARRIRYHSVPDAAMMGAVIPQDVQGEQPVMKQLAVRYSQVGCNLLAVGWFK